MSKGNESFQSLKKILNARKGVAELANEERKSLADQIKQISQEQSNIVIEVLSTLIRDVYTDCCLKGPYEIKRKSSELHQPFMRSLTNQNGFTLEAGLPKVKTSQAIEWVILASTSKDDVDTSKSEEEGKFNAEDRIISVELGFIEDEKIGFICKLHPASDTYGFKGAIRMGVAELTRQNLIKILTTLHSTMNPIEESKKTKNFPAIQRTQVLSSFLSSVGYEYKNHILEIEFVEGQIYQYFDVPQKIYVDLMKAQSHEEYFNEFIGNAFYNSLVISQTNRDVNASDLDDDYYDSDDDYLGDYWGADGEWTPWDS